MMMVIVYVIAHEGSLITRDTISNNISNPPFEPQSESADQSWSSQAPYSFLLKPNSPFNPLLCLSDAIVWSQIALRKKAIKLFFWNSCVWKSLSTCQFWPIRSTSPKERKQQDRKWIQDEGCGQGLRIRENKRRSSDPSSDPARRSYWPCYTFVLSSRALLEILLKTVSYHMTCLVLPLQLLVVLLPFHNSIK